MRERKVLCREGDHRVPESQILHAPRQGGGNYRRATRQIDSSLCVECARSCLASKTPGHYLVGSLHWQTASLHHKLNSYDEKQKSQATVEQPERVE